MKGTGDFEVAILLPDVNEKLLAAGKIKPEAYELSRVPIAFAVRGNATVDVSTPEKVKAALLGATSVKYAPTGAALLTVNKVLDTLKIRDQVKDNSKVQAPAVLTGNQYEINIYPISEIVVRTDVKNLGAVIKELQVPSIIEATIGAKTPNETAARALIKFLQSPAIDAELKKNAMEKGQGKQIASN